MDFRTYLNVPYAERKQAAVLGARWDAVAKKWYVPEGMLLSPFEGWLGTFLDAVQIPSQTKKKRVAPPKIKAKPKQTNDDDATYSPPWN